MESETIFIFLVLFSNFFKLEFLQLRIIYSISMMAPIFVSCSFSFSASSFEMSSLTIVGTDSTNFFACTKFIPSNRFLTSFINAIFFVSSNLTILTLKDVWTFLGATSSSSSAKNKGLNKTGRLVVKFRFTCCGCWPLRESHRHHRGVGKV